MATIRTSDSQSIYDLKYPGAAIDTILDTAYDLQNAGYIFRGLASEYSNTPTERSWVLAGEGETGHGFTTAIPKGYIGVCVFDGTSWTGKLLKCVSIDSTPTSGSGNAISSGGAYASINNLATFIDEALDNLTFTDTTPSAFLGDYIKMKVSTTDGGIERILTYFTILAATTEKAGLLSAADKAKLDAILGNLRSLEIDDTTAYADLGDKIVESLKATIGGTEETISTFQLLAATASKAGLLSAADKAKLDALWSSGYQFAGIATPSTTPISTTSKIFYIATEAGTYFNAVTVTNGINILSWDGSAWSAVQVVGIDEKPTDGSSNLPESGGIKSVFNSVHKNIGGANLVNTTEWEQGAISSEDGTNVTTHRNYRIRTTDVLYTHNDMKVTLPQGMSVYVFLYDSNETFIESNGWLESATIMAGSYYRLVFAYDTADTHPETPITVDDLQYVNMGVIALYETGSKVYDAVLNFNVTLDSQKIIGRYISAVDLVWHNKTSTYNADGIIVDVRRFKGQVVRLFNETSNFYYAALIDDSHAVDDMPTYANLDKRKAVTANTVEELLITGNINYLYILVHNISGDLVYPDVDIIGKVNYQNEKVIEHDSDIKEIQTSVFDTEIEEEDVPVVSRYINSKTKKWGASTTAKGVMIDVSSYHGRSISFENKNENKAYFAELADNDTEAGTTPSYTTPDQRKYVNPDTKVVIKVANETNYIYVSSVSLSGDDIYPEVTILSKIVAEAEDVMTVPLIYKNVQKKAAQFQYLTWFAKAAISNNITEGEHVGMIYSSCQEVDRYLFYDISLKSFMTSVNNPYSLLYTEHLEEDHHASGYGFTYYTNRNTGRAYMGTVCSRLTGYASGVTMEYDTGFMEWLCKEGIFTAIDDQTAQGVEIGDWIWKSGHVRIITNVEKEEGVVTSVTVTEAWIPLCRALTLSPTAFNNYITNNKGIIYRYNKLFENVVYQPSEFVNVEDEPSPAEYEYNNDICTYAGDKAAFYEGFPIWLNYNLDSEATYSWTHIKLYKESWSRANVLTTELVGTYEIDAAEHKYQLPELEYGLYRACMTDGENDSYFTYFEVIQVNEYVTDEGSGVKRVDFSSPNGTPVRVVFCQIDGTPMAIKDLSYDDRLNGTITMNPAMLCSLQRRQTLPSDIYLRVYVVGKYGRVSRQITMNNERFINWE